MKPRATLKCNHCDGSGQKPIGEVHQATLDALGTSWLTVEELRNRLTGVTGPAVAARLNWLEEHGFVERGARPGNGADRDATEWRRR